MSTIGKSILIALISVCATVVVMLLIWTSSSVKPPTSDKPPDGEEQSAIVNDSSEDDLNPPDGGGGLRLEYAKEITIDLRTDTAALYFKNSEKSLQDVRLSLIIQNNVVLQSDMISPGNALTAIPLPAAEFPLKNGNYAGILLVEFFNEDGKIAQINARIEGISVTII